MKNWNKRQVARETVAELNSRYGVDALTASILARRGVTEGADVQFFLEDSGRFMHSPFEFSGMEDVVDRIMQAKDEGEIVLVFGDSDVDGITSTTVLFDALSSLGIDVRWRLPSGADPYGLNTRAIDDFEREGGTLVITVDCGISNVDEIAYASSKGMDVIVLDHHNPPDTLPSPAVIIDPKCADSGYPFRDISGCAVAYKVAGALRFAQTELYKNEVALIAARRNADGTVSVDALKTENLVERSRLSLTVRPGTDVFATELPIFLRGQQLFAWDARLTRSLLAEAFGTGADFQLADFRSQAAGAWKWAASVPLESLRGRSRLACYHPEKDTDIDALFNLFVTYCSQMVARKGGNALADERDLQLVALAALADIMPLVDENRIFVRSGVRSLCSAENVREGLRELLSMLDLLGKRITSTALSWSVVPVLNATGRLRQPEVGIRLLLEKDGARRTELARKVLEMNEERKRLGAEAWEYGRAQAEKSIAENGGRLCVVVDERINRGVSGIVAGKLVSAFSVPAMAITTVDDVAIGSMRSCRSFDATVFLDALDREGAGGPLFISHGGHNYAAGFSFRKERMGEFLDAVRRLVPSVTLGADEGENFDVDAEIPERYLTPELLDVVDRLEPYGDSNRELLFMSRALRIDDCLVVGKGERQHLKLTFDCGGVKWPAMVWGGAEMLHRDFDKGDRVDLLYHVGRNTYQGIERPQLIVEDIRLSM